MFKKTLIAGAALVVVGLIAVGFYVLGAGAAAERSEIELGVTSGYLQWITKPGFGESVSRPIPASWPSWGDAVDEIVGTPSQVSGFELLA